MKFDMARSLYFDFFLTLSKMTNTICLKENRSIHFELINGLTVLKNVKKKIIRVISRMMTKKNCQCALDILSVNRYD